MLVLATCLASQPFFNRTDRLVRPQQGIVVELIVAHIRSSSAVLVRDVTWPGKFKTACRPAQAWWTYDLPARFCRTPYCARPFVNRSTTISADSTLSQGLLLRLWNACLWIPVGARGTYGYPCHGCTHGRLIWFKASCFIPNSCCYDCGTWAVRSCSKDVASSTQCTSMASHFDMYIYIYIWACPETTYMASKTKCAKH